MMIQLYGMGPSRSFRCLWALEEAGIPYEYISISLGQSSGGGSQTLEYKSLNFQGKVPTLVDDALVLTESAAILNYIAALAPDKALVPVNDIALRARYDEICYFVLSDLEQPLWTNGKHRFVLPEPQRVPEVLATAEWEFNKSLRALDHHLSNRQYAVGDQFTCADILIAQTIRWADRFKFEVPDRFLSYQEALFDRPACQRAQAKLA
ncbi:MAG: glutathione S-transferase family protein [Endozoicomonas sp.]